ncbi:MAG: D-alanyl-D-alanine carboxypeptidase family protein [Candidatus Pacebacteria bacterium]|nr:D-alanyl-D-alanine carboxypeptidase family protein [Candidatus Paceibacterota bacterium]
MLQVPRKKGPRRLFYAIIIGILALVVVGIYVGTRTVKKTMENKTSRAEREALEIAQEKQELIAQKVIPPFGTVVSGQEYIQFTGEDFKNFYDQHIYNNVEILAVSPEITGDALADAHIQTLAENRGYKLRPIADESALGTIQGQRLQKQAHDDLVALQTASKEATGQEFVFASGYRPVLRQRELFLAKLATKNFATIPTGAFDTEIDSILVTRSIPGYSKHHTGYTVDFGCNNHNLEYAFAETPCFTWLSENNYENAKRFGFLPSYPDGSGKQGPDPEPWEYVWVGKDVLLASHYSAE